MTLSGSSNTSPLRSWVGGSRTGGSDDRQTIITPQGHYYPGLRGVREVGTSSSPNSLEGSSSPCQSDCRQREQERWSEGCSSAAASPEGGHSTLGSLLCLLTVSLYTLHALSCELLG